MKPQPKVSLTLGEIAQTLASYYRIYNRNKKEAEERRKSGASVLDVEASEWMADRAKSQIDGVEGLLTTYCGLTFIRREATCDNAKQYAEVICQGWNPFSPLESWLIFRRETPKPDNGADNEQ